MSYIAFLDMTGTRAFASISSKEYTEAINDFNNSLKQVSELCDCQIYGYSDNAYVEIKGLNDVIKFFRLLRSLLMRKHRYFSATVDCGSLDAENLPLSKSKGFLMMFTAPAVIDLYLNQCNFSGIGISLSKGVVDKLKSKGMQDAFCPSIFQKISSTDKEQALEKVMDISYESVTEDNLRYIISDYVMATVMNEKAGQYYITPIISMIKALNQNEVKNDAQLDALISLISFKTLPEAFQIKKSYDNCSLLFLLALIDYVLSLRERDDYIDSVRICQRIVAQSDTCSNILIQRLSTIPSEVISNIHKRQFISIVYNMAANEHKGTI